MIRAEWSYIDSCWRLRNASGEYVGPYFDTVRDMRDWCHSQGWGLQRITSYSGRGSPAKAIYRVIKDPRKGGEDAS